MCNVRTYIIHEYEMCSLGQWKNKFRNLLDLILSISTHIQSLIKISRMVQELGPVSLFQNNSLGKASTDDKWHLATRSVSYQYKCVCKILSKHCIPYGSRVMGNFHIFTIGTSAKPQPMKNYILHYLGLDLFNINVYRKCHQNILYGSRDRASSSFSEFGPWQSLDRWTMAFGNPLG